MRILIAVHHFPPTYNGGAEKHALNVARGMTQRGHTVQVVTIERIDHGSPGSIEYEDSIYQGIMVRRLRLNLIQDPQRETLEYENPWIGRHLRQLIQEWQPDVFHLISGYLMTASAIEAANLPGIRRVVTLTDYWFLCRRINLLKSNGSLSTQPIQAETCARCLGEEKRRYRIPGLVAPGLMNFYWKLQTAQTAGVFHRMDTLQSAMQKVDAFISPSKFLRSIYIKNGVSPENIQFIRHGIELPDEHPEQPRLDQPLRVGFIGQISSHKGVHTLIQAVRLIPQVDLSLKIYGNPEPFPEYTRQLIGLARNDQRITFEGAFEGKASLSRALYNLDILVVPSLWYENCPLSILEACAHQVPVIASNLGGMPELIQPGKNGFLFEPGDAAQLASHLLRCADQPDIISTMKMGIEPVKTIHQEMEQIEAVYLSHPIQVHPAPAETNL